MFNECINKLNICNYNCDEENNKIILNNFKNGKYNINGESKTKLKCNITDEVKNYYFIIDDLKNCENKILGKIMQYIDKTNNKPILAKKIFLYNGQYQEVSYTGSFRSGYYEYDNINNNIICKTEGFSKRVGIITNFLDIYSFENNNNKIIHKRYFKNDDKEFIYYSFSISYKI